MTAASAHRERASGWLLVGGIVLASLTEAIAGTALTLGRSDAIGDIHATPDEFAWLDIGYTAAKLIGFALTPWLWTRVRPGDALFAATLAMGAACAVAAATAGLPLLILLRTVQGLAGAILLVSGQSILFQTYAPARQPMVQAVFAIGAVVAPATLAPALQGWLLDSQNWTWIFLAVVPLSLAAAGLMLMDETAAAPPDPSRSLDWPGLVLLAVALTAASWVLGQGSRWNWFEESRIGWLTAVVAAGVALFAIRQRHIAERGLFDLGVFRTDDFSFAFAVSFVAGAALFGSAFLIPAFAVSVLGFTPTGAGMLLLPSGALFVGALLLAGAAMQYRRVPPIATVPLGILLIMAAMWMLAHSAGDSGADDMMPAILLRGLGLGFLFLSITLIAFGRLPATGLASGIALFSIGRQLGGLIGVAGLQTAIDHHGVANQAVLGATLNPGSPVLAERLAVTTSLLVARGLDAQAAGKAAASLVGRAIAGQSAVIAFDTAFALVALLFVIAAPVLIGFKLVLARTAARRLGGDAA